MSEAVGSDAVNTFSRGENARNEDAQHSSPTVTESDTVGQQTPTVFVQVPTSLSLMPNSHAQPAPATPAAASSIQPPLLSAVSRNKTETTHPLVTAVSSVQQKPQPHQRYHYHHNQQLVSQRQHGSYGTVAPSVSPSPSVFYSSPASSYEEQRLTSITGPGSQYVKLNVGGSLHYTTIATLTKQPDSMLRAMFSGRLEVLTDSEGWILIDRCGKHFPLILNYLRDSNVALPESRREVMEILAEAKYYCLQGLVELCTAWLELSQQVEEEPAVCKVPVITSPKEEKALLQSTTKPVVQLLLNRHNNKYSYTPQSDDNLLRNLELFDKLVLRFHERVMFIKHVGSANEVCSWSFYGHGKKIAEVCCTSIVYATDKKHTKVEFPEARIYEEAMNILLFEPPVVCSLCQSVACQSSTCNDTESPEASSSPCCAADCERVQLEKLQKARSTVRATASGGRSDCNGNSGHGGGNSV